MINSTLIFEGSTSEESFKYWRDIINPAMEKKCFRTVVSIHFNEKTEKHEVWVGHKIHTTYEPFSLDHLCGSYIRTA